MRARKSFSEATLRRLREMPANEVLAQLAMYAKADRTYRPVKAGHSQRWHVRTVRGEFELLTTGTKWYDTRRRRGGGGAIDLTMHVLDLSFVDAVKQLIGEANHRGSDHP